MSTAQINEWELLDAAVDALALRLPPSWGVEKLPPADNSGIADLLIKLPHNNGQAVLLVEVKTKASPRDVEVLMESPWARRWRRQTGNQPLLFVAPYIGPRVRELLTETHVNYLDLTGNIHISIDSPAIFIRTAGASRDPRSTKQRATIRGAKAGSVVRVLVDAAPPYAGAEIARAAGVSEGYVSRLLDTLGDLGLIDRERPGPVVRVDWTELLRQRSQTLDLFLPTEAYRYVARGGPGAVLNELQAGAVSQRWLPTVTGSFAAARLAPVAAPALLVIYTSSTRELASKLDLLPADSGADTILISPKNDSPFQRAERIGGMAWAAPSQVAIDCLAGNGRMPSEGESLLAWMQEDESRWRFPTIRALLTADSKDMT